jgi:hypothetical protein
MTPAAEAPRGAQVIAAVRTDIAADKKIFRCRGPWRAFFNHHGLQPGDRIVIKRLSAYEYHVLRAP